MIPMISVDWLLMIPYLNVIIVDELSRSIVWLVFPPPLLPW